MARKIPWMTDAESSPNTQRKAPVLRVKPETPISSDDGTSNKVKPHQTSSPLKSPGKPQRKKRKSSRTPSTSPPPAPPEIEFMHEGYHADDIYMLVEDEFQTMAQSFTQHLHHAEYIRLKKKARQAPPALVAQPTNDMRTELKRKLEANSLHKQQEGAVRTMANGRGQATLGNEQEANERDPWQGTSLAGLMTMDSSQRRTALVGLEKISSSTRAARGFGRGEGESPTRREEKRSIMELYGGKSNRAKTSSPTAHQAAAEEDEEVVDEDDLDALPRAMPILANGKERLLNPATASNSVARGVSPRLPPKSNISPPPPFARPEALTKPKTGTSGSRHQSKISSKRVRSRFDNLDDLDAGITDDIPARSKSVFSSAGKSIEQKRKKEKDRKSRLNEVPTFLI